MTTRSLSAALLKASELDLSSSSLHALAIIADNDEPTMTEIASKMKVDPANITGMADRLEKLGFVRRVFGDRDRRKVRLQITDDGRNAMADIIASAIAAEWADLQEA